MKFSVLSFQFVDDEPGMSFGSRSDCHKPVRQCPLMKAWCEIFESKQQLFERAEVVSSFCKICHRVQYDEESEMLLGALKKVAFFQPLCVS